MGHYKRLPTHHKPSKINTFLPKNSIFSTPKNAVLVNLGYEKLDKKDVALKHYKEALLISKKFPLLEEMREEIVKHIKHLNKELEGK